MTDTEVRSSRSVLLAVSEVVEETRDARSLVFDVPADVGERFTYKPGQFLTLRIPSDRTGSVARCYSLSSAPVGDARPKVTIKRTRDGFGSNWLCDNVSVGDSIEVLPPAGVFTPASFEGDFLLWAGGSGITPVMSILKTALAQGSGRVVLFYANRDEQSVIFGDELRGLASQYPARLTVVHWLESVQGIPSGAQLAAVAKGLPGHESFICGPPPFMDTVRQALSMAGVAKERVHAEVFTSLTGDPFEEVALLGVDGADDGAGVLAEVELDGAVHNLTWSSTQSLVEALLARGIDAPYSCREGECGSCACTVVAGEVTMDKTGVLDDEDIEAGYVLGCQARPCSESVKIRF